MADCFQDQLKKFPWSPERAAALFKAAKEQYFDQGKGLEEAINGLSAQTGLRREVIAQGIASLKGVSRKMTDEMWLKQRQRRVMEQQAKSYVSQLGRSSVSKAIGTALNVPRRVATIGHFTVFPKTHLADLLFTDPKTFGTTFARSLKLATKSGIVEHEQRMTAMKLDSDYTKALRAGLDVEPGSGYGAFRGARQEILGTAKETRSAMAFDELRAARFGIFKNAIEKLSPEERASVDNLKPIAEVVNNQTGAATIKSKLGRTLTKFLFAPRLFPAQVRATFVDPYRAFVNGVVDRGNASPGDLVAARVVGRRIATLALAYTGTLAAEAGYSWATGDKKNMPNILDPGRSDWLRPRLFGHAIPVSPTVELLRLPFRMAYIGSKLGPAEAAKVPANYLLGRQNPALAIGEEIATGREPYQMLSDYARPLPFRGALGTPKAGKYSPQMGWTEFLGQKMPIPVATVSREVYDEMREQGMNHIDAKTWIHALALGAITGTAGYEATPVREYQSKAYKKVVPPGQQGWLQQMAATLNRR